MSDNNFIGGMFAKEPHENAPDFVKAGISIKLSDFAQYLRELKAEDPEIEWLNAQLKVSKGGKLYIERDTWKPKEAAPAPEPASSGGGGIDDDIPFMPLPSIP